MRTNTKHIFVAAGIFILALCAVYADKWDYVGAVITGFFALLNLSTKGITNEKTSTLNPS